MKKEKNFLSQVAGQEWDELGSGWIKVAAAFTLSGSLTGCAVVAALLDSMWDEMWKTGLFLYFFRVWHSLFLSLFCLCLFCWWFGELEMTLTMEMTKEMTMAAVYGGNGEEFCGFSGTCVVSVDLQSLILCPWSLCKWLESDIFMCLLSLPTLFC